MESLADVWVRSGKNSKYLYLGKREEIITELKSWVKRRKILNNIKMVQYWDVFRIEDYFQETEAQLVSNQEPQTQAEADQNANFMAIQMRIRIRYHHIEKKTNRENLLAAFLLASLRHEGVRWPPVLCSKGCQVEACVCGCLGIVDQDFNAETELKTLEDRERRIQWIYEYKERKESIGARHIAKGPVPEVNSHLRAVCTADLLGNTDVAAGETNPGTENHVVYIADTLGNITTATRPSSSVAVDTSTILDDVIASLSKPSNDTQNVAGPSSSTSTKIGVKIQNTPGTEGQDEVGKMSKAKKKREQKKRAKARAKEAAANAEDTVGNDDDDDNDGDVPSLVAFLEAL